MRKLLLMVACLLICSSAHGQSLLSFAGGNGQPLSVTLSSPVSYLVTGSSLGDPPVFNFQGVGNLFEDTSSRVLGSIAFTINGGMPLTIQYLSSGYVGGVVQATDLFATGPFFGAASSVNAGQIVTLLAGTSITVANFVAAPPVNGSYPTVLTAGQGTAISGPGLTVPEPSTVIICFTSTLCCMWIVASHFRISKFGSPH